MGSFFTDYQYAKKLCCSACFYKYKLNLTFFKEKSKEQMGLKT